MSHFYSSYLYIQQQYFCLYDKNCGKNKRNIATLLWASGNTMNLNLSQTNSPPPPPPRPFNHHTAVSSSLIERINSAKVILYSYNLASSLNKKEESLPLQPNTFAISSQGRETIFPIHNNSRNQHSLYHILACSFPAFRCHTSSWDFRSYARTILPS